MSIDLFSSAWGRQLETLVSWETQSLAHSVDTFSQDWSQWKEYALILTFSQIHRCLGKIRKNKADMVLVAPYWPALSWFLTLLEFACEPPLVTVRKYLPDALYPIGCGAKTRSNPGLITGRSRHTDS